MTASLPPVGPNVSADRSRSVVHYSWIACRARRKTADRTFFKAMSLLALTALLTGCATEKPKPWEHTKPKWYEPDLDPDDRAFYHDFFFGR